MNVSGLFNPQGFAENAADFQRPKLAGIQHDQELKYRLGKLKSFKEKKFKCLRENGIINMMVQFSQPLLENTFFT